MSGPSTLAAQAATSPHSPLADARIEQEIDLACVRTLYQQIPNSFAAAMVVTVYMVLTLWEQVSHAQLMAWLGVQALAQVHRWWVLLGYRRADRAGLVDAAHARLWARRHTIYLGIAGGVWALAAALFLHTEHPLAVAFTLCGLYGITGGAVPGNAYNKPAVMAFIWPVFSAVMLKLAWSGRLDFIALGLASMAYAGILTMFCRVQHVSIRDALRVRFENQELLAQLAVEKADADAARHRAEVASLAKSQFLAAASHDLRQPLHALGLFSASLQGLRLDEQAQQVVHNIQGNIDALEDLFDALLDVSKLDAGVVEAHMQSVDLHALMGSVARGLQAVAHEHGLRLSVSARSAWVQADPVLLRRILGNLLSNALRYTHDGAVMLAVRRCQGGQAWRIECRDSGVGISPPDQRRIFDEFVQLHNPERDRRHGLGLGLAIAQRCAVLLGAHIDVRSQPGQGSVFSLVLPATPPLAGAPAATVPAGAGPDRQPGASAPAARLPDGAGPVNPLQGRHILVVDDEVSIRDGLALLLRQWGCRVSLAGDHDEALAMVGPDVDLLLTDLRLPHGRNGLQTVQALRQRQARPLPACLVTGESDAAALTAARDSGVPLLHKPVRAAQLRATMLHLLSGA